MSFTQFYGLKYKKITESTMAQIDEQTYRLFANTVDDTVTIKKK